MIKSQRPINSFVSPTLSLKNLGLYKGGRWLFRKLHLNISCGSFIAVAGPSGVGKSSFIACLAGLEEPTEGTLSYITENGTVYSPREVRRFLGIIFQNLNLVENETVLTNVLCGRLNSLSWLNTLTGFPRSFKKEAYRILYDLGIADYIYRWAAEVSGGEKQRIAIARTLFQAPSIYLADEPVSQLDTYFTGRILGKLKLEIINHRKTVFCVLHDSQLIERFADYVLSFNFNHPEKWNLREIH